MVDGLSELRLDSFCHMHVAFVKHSLSAFTLLLLLQIVPILEITLATLVVAIVTLLTQIHTGLIGSYSRHRQETTGYKGP